MPDVFASSTALVTAALGNLVTNILAVFVTLIAAAFGFVFLRWLVRKAKGVPHGKV